MRAMTITLLSSLILLGCHGKATVEQPELTSTLSHEVDFEPVSYTHLRAHET